MGVVEGRLVPVVLEDSRTRRDAVARGLGSKKRGCPAGALGQLPFAYAHCSELIQRVLPSRTRFIDLSADKTRCHSRSSSRPPRVGLRCSLRTKASLCLTHVVSSVTSMTLRSGSPNGDPRYGIISFYQRSLRSLRYNATLSPMIHDRIFACGPSTMVLAPTQCHHPMTMTEGH